MIAHYRFALMLARPPELRSMTGSRSWSCRCNPHPALSDNCSRIDHRGASAVAATSGGASLLPRLPPAVVVRQADHLDAAAQMQTY